MTSTSRQPVTHTVEVGKVSGNKSVLLTIANHDQADYTFVPDVVLAEAGDYIEYAFYPRNHSVVQADYEYPCVPVSMRLLVQRGILTLFVSMAWSIQDSASILASTLSTLFSTTHQRILFSCKHVAPR